ncbi:MAG: 30S ribosomal protein S16 [Planctomycetota bacterium]
MVRLRLMRLGRRNRPFYRLNAIDQRTRREGKVIENLGWYNPIETDESKQVELKPERIAHWLSMGARPSDTVADMLGKRDMLTPKLKEEWETRRARDRKRVEDRLAAKKAEEEAARKAEEEAKAAEEAAKKAEEEAKAAEGEGGE